MPENSGEKKEKTPKWKYEPFYRDDGNRKRNERIRDEVKNVLNEKGYDDEMADRMLAHTFDQAVGANDEVALMRAYEQLLATPERSAEPSPPATNRNEAKEKLIAQGMSSKAAEVLLRKSFDRAVAQKDQEKIDRILYNISNSSAGRRTRNRNDVESSASQEATDRMTEEDLIRSLETLGGTGVKKERTPKKAAEDTGEQKFTVDGEFPSSAELFGNYLNGEIDGKPATHELEDLVKQRIGALEEPLRIAGATTKTKVQERLAELGFIDEYKSLVADAKSLQQFLKDAKNNRIDPLVIKSRFVQMERFRARSGQFYQKLESRLGQPETDLDTDISQEEHAAHAEAVKESLKDIVRMTEGMAPSPDEVAPEPKDPYPWRKGIEKFSEDEAYRKDTEDTLDAMHQRFLDTIPPEMAAASLSMVTEFQTREREIKDLLATSSSGAMGGMYGHEQEIEYTPDVKQLIAQKLRELSAFEQRAYRDLNIVGPSAYEDSRVEWKDARAEWQRVKPKYEAELKKHYDQLSSRSLWQKFRKQGEEKSPELTALEAEYLAARQRYVGAIKDGLSARAASREGGSRHVFEHEKIRSAIAGRFVVKAAHEKFAIEEQSVAEHRPELVKKFGAWYGRNKKMLGYGVAALGVLSTFGVLTTSRFALKAGGAYVGGTVGTSMAKAASLLSFAALGGIIGGAAGNRAVEYFDTRHKRALKKADEGDARKEVSADNLEVLERRVFESTQALRKSEKRKRNATIAGAVAGGLVGGYAGGVAADDVYHLAGSLDLPGMSYPGEVPPGAVAFDYGNENILDLPAEPSTPPENTLDLPPQENILDLPTPIPPHGAGSVPTPPENILDLPPEENILDLPPTNGAASGPHIPRPAGVTPPQHFEYATPDHAPIPTPRPEVELPQNAPIPEPRPIDLPDHAPIPEPRPLDLPDHAPIPEARPDYYTVQKGDNIWNIVEGDVKDRDMAEVLKKIPDAHRNEDLMELRAHINADPELRARIGMHSANADLIDPGERLNMTPAYQELQKIALERGHITEADMTVVPAAPSEAVAAHAEAAYPIQKGDDLWKIIERRYHDQLADMSKAERNAFIDAKLDALEASPSLRHELGLVRDDLDLIKETDPPLHLDVLDRLQDSSDHGVPETVPAHDVPIEEVAPRATVTPQDTAPSLPDEPLDVREASVPASETAPTVDLSTLRDTTIRQVEGAPGAFRLFNSSAGSFAKLADVKMSEIVPTLDGSSETVRANFLKAHGITENGFEKWIKWAADHEEELGIKPTRNETFGQFADRVLAAQQKTVAA